MRFWTGVVLAAVGAVALVTSHGPTQAQSGKLVLYTSQPDKDAQETVAGFRKRYPGVEVDIFRSGTTEVMGKLAAEFSAGQAKADVLLIADAVSMEALKAENRLLQYSEAKADGFRDGAIDPEKYYFGSKLITTGIAYNTDAKVKPESWADLAKPEFKGQISMPSPLYSGAAAIMLSAMAERTDLGWKFFEALRSNEAASVRGNGAVLKSVATGEKPYGVLVDFMALNAKEKGSPIAFVFPKEGVPAVTEPVAILKTTQNVAAAKAFVDFILSDEGQKLAVSQGYVPAKNGVAPPSWFPAGTTINIMSKDLKGILARTEADKKRFSDMFGG
jgi:iron(III) transport system substrate-binding protein